MLYTPTSLFGMTRSRLKVGNKCHSGSITEGVADRLAASPRPRGSQTAKPSISWNTPKITIGKMYKMSFGHAGSAYVLWPMPFDNLDATRYKLKVAGSGC